MAEVELSNQASGGRRAVKIERVDDLLSRDAVNSTLRAAAGTPLGTVRARARVMSCVIVRRWLVGGWCVAAIALFVLVVTRQPMGRIAEACVAMGPAVLLAPCIAAVWLATRTTTLQRVLARRVPWRVLLGVRAIGDGYNALVPAAGLAGEPYKLRRVAAWLPIDQAVAGLVRDRLFDNALGLLFSAGGIALGLPRLAVPPVIGGALWTYAAIAGPAGVVMLALAAGRAPGRLGVLASRWAKRTSRPSEALPLAAILQIIGWSLATRVLQTFETTLLLACIGGPVSVPSVLVVDGALNAAGFVGFLMPQGLGVVEGAAVYVLTALGSPAAAATAFALARRGRVLVVSGAGVAVHVAGHLRMSLRSLTSRAVAE